MTCGYDNTHGQVHDIFVAVAGSVVFGWFVPYCVVLVGK
jgi:hypothetical protein